MQIKSGGAEERGENWGGERKTDRGKGEMESRGKIVKGRIVKRKLVRGSKRECGGKSRSKFDVGERG